MQTLTVSPAMASGKHRISLKVEMGQCRGMPNMQIICGLGKVDSEETWDMHTATCGLYGKASPSNEDRLPSSLCGLGNKPDLHKPLSQEEATRVFDAMMNGAMDHNYIKHNSQKAGSVPPGSVLTMEVNVEEGTLKWWKDGIPWGPGFESGVTGPCRWKVKVGTDGNFVEIVEDPELQPWKEWDGQRRDDEEFGGDQPCVIS